MREDERGQAVLTDDTGEDRSRDIDIYDDDEAVSVVGGLFVDPECDPAASRVPGTRLPPGETGGVEYTVSEFRSVPGDTPDEDDMSARDAVPIVRDMPAKPGRKAEEADYTDYIRSTSIEIAKERIRKEQVAMTRTQDKNYIRDASRSPAVRKDKADKRDERASEGLPPQTERAALTSKTKIRDFDHQGASGHEQQGRHETGRAQAAYGKYAAQASAPPKPASSRRSEFFDPDSKKGYESTEAMPFPGMRVVVIAAFAVALLIMVFLIINNRALASDLDKAENGPPTQEAVLASELYQTLKITSDSQAATIKDLEEDLEYYKNLAASGAADEPSGDDGTTPGSISGEGTGRPMPTTPPPAPSSREYTVVSGDTLQKIARTLLGNESRFNEIKELNGMTSDNLQIGQVLRIPSQ